MGTRVKEPCPLCGKHGCRHVKRRVVRETCDRDPGWHKTIMVELAEGGRFIRVWQKGRRLKLTVTYADIWRLAYSAELRRAREEKKARQRNAR